MKRPDARWSLAVGVAPAEAYRDRRPSAQARSEEHSGQAARSYAGWADDLVALADALGHREFGVTGCPERSGIKSKAPVISWPSAVTRSHSHGREIA